MLFMENEDDVPLYALPHTSESFLLLMEEQRHALMETVRALSDDQIAAPSTPTEWSVKDHLAHLAVWAAGMVALLKKENRWEAMGLDPQFVYHTEGYDEINALIYHQHKDRSLPHVLTYFNNVHGQLSHAIRHLHHEELYQTYSYYQPDEPGEDSGEPIIKWLVSNSYGHYAEHLAWIQEMIAEKG
jgi:hypothetical protein